MDFTELPSGLIVPSETEPPNNKPRGLLGHGVMDLESKGTPEIRHQGIKQIRDFPPTSADCQKIATLFDDSDKHERHYANWHPQWGGYYGKSVVIVTPGDVDGCFQVINWHDGEFPRDDSFVEYHYCAATQIVNQGITVLEKQLDGANVLRSSCHVSTDWLREAAKRLVAIADRCDGMEQLC